MFSILACFSSHNIYVVECCIVAMLKNCCKTPIKDCTQAEAAA